MDGWKTSDAFSEWKLDLKIHSAQWGRSLEHISVLTCLSTVSVGQEDKWDVRFLSTYFAIACKLTVGTEGCATGTGLDVLEEWERGVDDTRLEDAADKGGAGWKEWSGVCSFSDDCCENTTGEPGELWWGLSSLQCKPTVTGDKACWGRPEVAGSALVAAAVRRKEDRLPKINLSTTWLKFSLLCWFMPSFHKRGLWLILLTRVL